jgi:hypothetical protein
VAGRLEHVQSRISEGQRPKPNRRREPISPASRNHRSHCLALDPQPPTLSVRHHANLRAALSAPLPRPSCSSPIAGAAGHCLPAPSPLLPAPLPRPRPICSSPLAASAGASLQGCRLASCYSPVDGVGDSGGEQVRYYLYRVIEISSLTVG